MFSPTPEEGVLVLVGLAVAALAAAAPRDPVETARWAYRMIIRARGGAFVSAGDAVLQSGSSDCGPAALAALIRALGGDPPPTEAIGRLAGTGARGTTLAGLALAAARLGVSTHLRRLDTASLGARGSRAVAGLGIEGPGVSWPVVAWVDRGHFVTVAPDPSGLALVFDPRAGSYRIGWTRLARYWKGEALVPSPRP